METYGVEGYAAVSLIMTLPAVFTFADLGMGASVVNAASDLSRGKPARAHLAASGRILLISATVIGLAAMILLMTNSWEVVLGPGLRAADAASIGASMMLTLVGAGVFASISVRILQGWRLNIVLATYQMLIPIVSLGYIIGAIAVGAPSGLTGAGSAVGTFATVLLMWISVRKRLRFSMLRASLFDKIPRDVLQEVLHVGSSSLIVNIGMALVYQSGRIWLSHVSTSDQLAQYSLVAPLFASCVSVINQVAQTLWPSYRQQLDTGTATVGGLLKDATILTVISLGGVVALLVGVPVVVLLGTGGATQVDLMITIGFGLLLVAQTAQLPATMVMTDRRGFSIQRNIVILLTVVNLGLTSQLAPAFGALGVLLASAASILLLQIPVSYFFSVKRIRQASAGM